MTGAKVYGAGALWAAVHRHRRWVVPSAMGLGLVILVGTMLWMSREDDPASPLASDTPATAAPAIKPSAPLAASPPAAAPQPPATPAPVPGGEGQASAPAAAAPAAVEPAAAEPTAAKPRAARVVARVEPLSASEDSAAAQPGPSSGLRATGAPGAPAVAGQANRAAVRRPTARPAPTGASTLAGGGGARLPALAPDECAVRISSRPWAEVWIDGKNTGRKTPVDNLKVACGTRKLELKRPDKDIEQMEMLDVIPGKAYRGDYELE